MLSLIFLAFMVISLFHRVISMSQIPLISIVRLCAGANKTLFLQRSIGMIIDFWWDNIQRHHQSACGLSGGVTDWASALKSDLWLLWLIHANPRNSTNQTTVRKVIASRLSIATAFPAVYKKPIAASTRRLRTKIVAAAYLPRAMLRHTITPAAIYTMPIVVLYIRSGRYTMYPGSDPERTRVPAIIVANPNKIAASTMTLWLILTYRGRFISISNYTPNSPGFTRWLRKSKICIMVQNLAYWWTWKTAQYRRSGWNRYGSTLFESEGAAFLSDSE